MRMSKTSSCKRGPGRGPDHLLRRSLCCSVPHIDDFLSASASLEESLLLPRN